VSELLNLHANLLLVVLVEEKSALASPSNVCVGLASREYLFFDGLADETL